jgi:hypothetical protein
VNIAYFATIPMLRQVVKIRYIFLLGSLALAGGKGKGKSKSVPPGWEQGEKAGWDGKDEIQLKKSLTCYNVAAIKRGRVKRL